MRPNRLVAAAGLTTARTMHPLDPKRRGFSLIELLVVVAVVLILAAVAIPNLIRARRAANEASAVASLRAISSGQMAYRHTQGVYATLAGLGAENVIDNVLASGSKSGYTFDSDAGADPAMEFTATAEPAITTGIGATGTRFYFVSQDQVIRFSVGAPADSTSSAIP
jgi:type IV pilus assembly protein PilA